MNDHGAPTPRRHYQLQPCWRILNTTSHHEMFGRADSMSQVGPPAAGTLPNSAWHQSCLYIESRWPAVSSGGKGVRSCRSRHIDGVATAPMALACTVGNMLAVKVCELLSSPNLSLYTVVREKRSVSPSVEFDPIQSLCQSPYSGSCKPSTAHMNGRQLNWMMMVDA